MFEPYLKPQLVFEVHQTRGERQYRLTTLSAPGKKRFSDDVGIFLHFTQNGERYLQKSCIVHIIIKSFILQNGRWETWYGFWLLLYEVWNLFNRLLTFISFNEPEIWSTDAGSRRYRPAHRIYVYPICFLFTKILDMPYTVPGNRKKMGAKFSRLFDNTLHYVQKGNEPLLFILYVRPCLSNTRLIGRPATRVPECLWWGC